MGSEARGAWMHRASAILDASGERSPRVLDMGAGQGHLVHCFRSMGFTADGVEPSPAGRAAARELYAIDLFDRVPTDRETTYSLATLIHSLEHARDPVGLLEDVRRILQPGGTVFIEVPNAESIEMWVPRRRREILDVPAHLFHFVPRTLTLMVERAGFRVTEVTLSNPRPLERAFSFWAGIRASRTGGATKASQATTTTSAQGREATTTRAWWRARALPAIRASFPGWKFHVVARLADARL